MNIALSSSVLQPSSLKDRVTRAGVLIFDVDGTLAETEGIHRRAFNAAFLECGADWYWDRRTYKKLLSITGGKERLRAYSRMQPPRQRLSDPQLLDLHEAKTRHYARLIAEHTCRLRPGVAAFIRSAITRGQTLGIATTTTPSNVEGLLAGALGRDWRSLFATVVAGDEVAHKKPAPDVYLEVLARLRQPADACLAIEDSANGLMAARSAGIPVLITRSDFFRDDDFSSALAVVDELTELV
ncbi:MAG TPA: HAD-IA family hydrolase [Bradyrhizobium sp.]|nr:HAD-IA family hydrolase [Bradyrhizobium sp.]